MLAKLGGRVGGKPFTRSQVAPATACRSRPGRTLAVNCSAKLQMREVRFAAIGQSVILSRGSNPTRSVVLRGEPAGDPHGVTVLRSLKS